MRDAKLRDISSEHSPTIPAEFEPVMQSLLATLADIDFAHQREVERVNSTALDDRFKTVMIARLDQHHRERRQPYAEEVLRLQQRMRSLLVHREEA
jgi:hypothetical protein